MKILMLLAMTVALTGVADADEMSVEQQIKEALMPLPDGFQKVMSEKPILVWDFQNQKMLQLLFLGHLLQII